MRARATIDYAVGIQMAGGRQSPEEAIQPSPGPPIARSSGILPGTPGLKKNLMARRKDRAVFAERGTCVPVREEEPESHGETVVLVSVLVRPQSRRETRKPRVGGVRTFGPIGVPDRATSFGAERGINHEEYIAFPEHGGRRGFVRAHCRNDGASIALSSGPQVQLHAALQYLNCTATGTLTVTPGNLTFTTPASLAWTSLLNGLGQRWSTRGRATSGDGPTTPADPSGMAGLGDRNHVHQQRLHTNNTLPMSDFSVTGSVTSPRVPPSRRSAAWCSTRAPCPSEWRRHLPPADPHVAHGRSYDHPRRCDPGTGVGNVQLGGSTSAAPLGWWLNVPGTALAGSYVSNLTATISSGP